MAQERPGRTGSPRDGEDGRPRRRATGWVVAGGLAIAVGGTAAAVALGGDGGAAGTVPAVPAAAPESAAATVAPSAEAPSTAAPPTTAPSTAAGHEGMVTGAVWVANEEDASLSVIDAATNTVVTTVRGVEGPHNVQVSPDSASVWAVSGHDSLAVALDARSLDLTRTVTTGGAPAHVVISPDGRTAYTSDGADGTVTVIDTASGEVQATIPVGAGPHGLRPSPDGRWLVVANVAGSTLSVVDTSTRTTVADIEVGTAPAQVAFSPDGRFVYASVSAQDEVVKVDMASREVVGRVTVGDGPIQTYVSPDDRYLLAANQGTEAAPGTSLSVIDTRTFTVTGTVETGRGAHGVVVDPSGRHAYVTNLYADDVAVVDLDELEVVARVPVGDTPNGISFSSTPVPAQAAPMRGPITNADRANRAVKATTPKAGAHPVPNRERSRRSRGMLSRRPTT